VEFKEVLRGRSGPTQRPGPRTAAGSGLDRPHARV